MKHYQFFPLQWSLVLHFYLLILCKCVNVCIHMHICHGKGQHSGVSFLLPPYGSEDSNSGHQAWRQAPWPISIIQGAQQNEREAQPSRISSSAHAQPRPPLTPHTRMEYFSNSWNPHWSTHQHHSSTVCAGIPSGYPHTVSLDKCVTSTHCYDIRVSEPQASSMFCLFTLPPQSLPIAGPSLSPSFYSS